MNKLGKNLIFIPIVVMAVFSGGYYLGDKDADAELNYLINEAEELIRDNQYKADVLNKVSAALMTDVREFSKISRGYNSDTDMYDYQIVEDVIIMYQRNEAGDIINIDTIR